MKGESGHGSGDLTISEFKKMFATMDVEEPEFNVESIVYIENIGKDGNRVIKLARKQLLIAVVTAQSVSSK